jgi:predicted PurR-regulated permease PerM
MFIPSIGPVLSVVPPALLALNDEPIKALYVVLYYLALQTLESYFITPMIQQKAISLPPVVIIAAQVIMGVLLGALGLALATPMVAAVMVLVQMLYLEDVLGDRNVHITGPGQDSSG